MVKKVSVIVPCYNGERYLEQCIKGIKNQTYSIKEIIIVDDGSKDKSVRVANRYKGKKLKVIRHIKNLGIATARNTGIINSEGDFIAFLDVDVIAERDWLEKLMKNFKTKKVVGVGGRLIEKFRDTIPNKWRAEHLSQEFKRWSKQTWISGANCVYKKSSLIEVGLFNNSLKTHGEDRDIGLRLTKTWNVVIQEPLAVAWHLRRDSTFSVLRAKWNWANSREGPRGPETYSIIVLFYKILYGGVWFIQVLKRDLFNKRFEFILIDLFFPFYWAGFTVKKYFRYKLYELRIIANSFSYLLNNFKSFFK